MTIETLTVDLFTDASGVKVKGADLISGDKDDTQIVTVTDGGNLKPQYIFEAWGKSTPTEAGAGLGGSDEFHFDLSTFNDDFSIAVKSFDADDQFVFTGLDSYVVVGGVWTITYTGSDGAVHTVSINPESTNGTGIATVVVCFVRGSLIQVPGGVQPIETLAIGDKVTCGDGYDRPIRWIGSRKLDAAVLNLKPELRPVRISPNALGPDCPKTELRLSPQHKVLLRDWRAELLFGEEEVLVPIKALIDDAKITQDSDCTNVEYFHILLESHQTIFANRLECETLMPAEMARTALSPQAREEIFNIFPHLVSDLGRFGPLCHRSLKPFEMDVMASYGEISCSLPQP